jgi:hypothetical protein
MRSIVSRELRVKLGVDGEPKLLCQVNAKQILAWQTKDAGRQNRVRDSWRILKSMATERQFDARSVYDCGVYFSEQTVVVCR